jgi:hypothetical protein
MKNQAPQRGNPSLALRMALDGPRLQVALHSGARSVDDVLVDFRLSSHGTLRAVREDLVVLALNRISPAGPAHGFH